jgi:hypothetical protein
MGSAENMCHVTGLVDLLWAPKVFLVVKQTQTMVGTVRQKVSVPPGSPEILKEVGS